jgi:hypothetical protein
MIKTTVTYKDGTCRQEVTPRRPPRRKSNVTKLRNQHKDAPELPTFMSHMKISRDAGEFSLTHPCLFLPQ